MVEHSRTGNIRDLLAPLDPKEEGEGTAFPKPAKTWSFRSSKRYKYPNISLHPLLLWFLLAENNQKLEGKEFQVMPSM